MQTTLTTGLQLAGFTLAHAAWWAADGALAPFLLIDDAAGRAVLRFDATSHEPALAQAERAIAGMPEGQSSWAFAREAQLRTGPRPSMQTGSRLAPEAPGESVIEIVFQSLEMSAPARLLQRFARQPGIFRLVGDPFVGAGSLALANGESILAKLSVMVGIDQHPAVAGLWDGWRGDR